MILLTLAFLLRLSFVLTLPNELHWPDEIDYDAMARHLVATGEYDITPRGPLYDFFLAGIYSVTGAHLIIIRLLQCLIDTASAFLVISLARLFFRSSRVAWIAGALYALYPFFIYFCGMLLSETLFIFLLLATVWSLASFQQTQKRGYQIAGGILLVLASLCRPVALFLIIPLGFWNLMITQGTPARKILSGLFFLFAASATLFPWTLRNYLLTGHFIPVSLGGGRSFWMGNSPETILNGSVFFPKGLEEKLASIEVPIPIHLNYDYTESIPLREQTPEIQRKTFGLTYERDQYLMKITLDYIKEKPGIFVTNMIKKLFLFWAPFSHLRANYRHGTTLHQWVGALSYLMLLIFSLIGLFQWSREKPRPDLSLLFVLIGSYVVGTALFITIVRYRAPIDPYLILFAAIPLSKLPFFTSTDKPPPGSVAPRR